MNTPSVSDEVKREIARGIVQVHEDSFGRSASNVKVALDAAFIAVTMDIELTVVEATLVAAGDFAAVKAGREAFQSAISATFAAIVERATGRRVVDFTSKAILEAGPPWAIEVFRLGAVPAGEEL